MELLNDWHFLIYGINFLLALYGFCLFAWWWWRRGGSTEIYAYITALFLSNVIMFGGNVHIRVIKWTDPMAAASFSDSFVFFARCVLHCVILLLIVYRMTIRIVRTYMYEKGKLKDRRKRRYYDKEGGTSR